MTTVLRVVSLEICYDITDSYWYFCVFIVFYSF